MPHPKTLKPGDRVYVAPDAAWTNGAVSDALQMLRGREATVITEADADGDVGLAPFGALCAAGFLTLIEESTPEPAPAVTDEQRAAVDNLTEWADERGDSVLANDWRVVRALLPSELTNPQPVLPTEPGHYLDKDGDAWRVYPDGVWLALWSVDPEERQDASPEGYAPFTRLVPERPQITREQIADHLAACSELPRLSNLDMADSILALVYGADQ